MRFEAAPLDQYAARITTGVAYVGGLLLLPLLFAYLSNTRWAGLLVPSALALPLAVFMLLCYAQQPAGYTIEKDAIVVRRRWWRRLRIPLADIRAVSFAPSMADIPRYGLRFAFNAGIFGYQGPFRLEPFGRIFFLATNRQRLVAIDRYSTTPLLISPANPRAFVDALNEQRGQAALDALAGTETR